MTKKHSGIEFKTLPEQNKEQNKEFNVELKQKLNDSRRSFLKTTAGSAAGLAAGGLLTVAPEKAEAFAYEPYPTDDELETVVTSCAHNCGSRHMLVAHKKGDVIVRLSTDDGSYHKDGKLVMMKMMSYNFAPVCVVVLIASDCIRQSVCFTL